MKIVLAAALVALTFTALPAAAKPCDENAPEAMKRPGGYCELLLGNSSLSSISAGQSASDSGNDTPSQGSDQPKAP